MRHVQVGRARIGAVVNARNQMIEQSSSPSHQRPSILRNAMESSAKLVRWETPGAELVSYPAVSPAPKLMPQTFEPDAVCGVSSCMVHEGSNYHRQTRRRPARHTTLSGHAVAHQLFCPAEARVRLSWGRDSGSFNQHCPFKLIQREDWNLRRYGERLIHVMQTMIIS
jgi:hypothetical protein